MTLLLALVAMRLRRSCNISADLRPSVRLFASMVDLQSLLAIDQDIGLVARAGMHGRGATPGPLGDLRDLTGTYR